MTPKLLTVHLRPRDDTHPKEEVRLRSQETNLRTGIGINPRMKFDYPIPISQMYRQPDTHIVTLESATDRKKIKTAAHFWLRFGVLEGDDVGTEPEDILSRFRLFLGFITDLKGEIPQHVLKDEFPVRDYEQTKGRLDGTTYYRDLIFLKHNWILGIVGGRDE